MPPQLPCQSSLSRQNYYNNISKRTSLLSLLRPASILTCRFHLNLPISKLTFLRTVFARRNLFVHLFRSIRLSWCFCSHSNDIVWVLFAENWSLIKAHKSCFFDVGNIALWCFSRDDLCVPLFDNLEPASRLGVSACTVVSFFLSCLCVDDHMTSDPLPDNFSMH